MNEKIERNSPKNLNLYNEDIDFPYSNSAQMDVHVLDQTGFGSSLLRTIIANVAAGMVLFLSRMNEHFVAL